VIIRGDALTELRKLPDEPVHCCVTSPPYWGLRDYGVAGQLGLEKTPEEYVAKMVEVFSEVRRVLRKDGTLWLNLGDSYWGGKGQSAHGGTEKQRVRFERNQSLNREYQEIGKFGWTKPSDGKHETIKPKDLVGIPWRVAFALQADGWWLRQDIIWAKPNPMPESVTDRCTKSHEYVFLLSKSAKYYYDADAVREDSVDPESINGRRKRNPREADKSGDKLLVQNIWKVKDPIPFRNRRSVWTITTKPFKEAHFATFPPEIPERCIKAGCPKGGIVLDPFFGAGTTGLVAKQLGRDFIGIELNQKYCDMAEKRIAQVGYQSILEMGEET